MGGSDPGPTHVEGWRVDLPSGLGSGTVSCSISGTQPSGGGVALLVPGMEGSASSYAPLIGAADRAGAAVLMPDMDDLGGPQGRDFAPFLRALARDGLPEPLGPLRAVIGHSLGARVALRALGSLPEDTEVTAIFVSAGAGSVGDDGGSVDGAPHPLLVVHSRGDVLSSHAGGEAVFDAAGGPKVMVSLEGTDHGAGVWTASSEELQEHVGAVIAAFLLGAPRRAWSDVQAAVEGLVDAGLGSARFDLDPSARPGPSGAPVSPGGGEPARTSTATVTDIRSREDFERLVGDRPPGELLVVLERYGIDRFLTGAFTHISSRFIPERSEGRDAVIQWHVVAPDGVHAYLLEVVGVRCEARAGEHPAPTLTVRIALEDLARFLAGRLDAMGAFVSGGLQVSGDLRFAVALERWFDHG
jgi:putative sterol carrier protein/pimeloyl-ACP methyl ester carboxylesterase